MLPHLQVRLTPPGCYLCSFWHIICSTFTSILEHFSSHDSHFLPKRSFPIKITMVPAIIHFTTHLVIPDLCFDCALFSVIIWQYLHNYPYNRNHSCHRHCPIRPRLAVIICNVNEHLFSNDLQYLHNCPYKQASSWSQPLSISSQLIGLCFNRSLLQHTQLFISTKQKHHSHPCLFQTNIVVTDSFSSLRLIYRRGPRGAI